MTTTETTRHTLVVETLGGMTTYRCPECSEAVRHDAEEITSWACRLHAAAPEMAAGLTAIADAEPDIDRFKEFGVARQLQDALLFIAAIKQTARALLRRLEG